MTYLDPKNDLTFKKIFGQHPHLLKSFLNAILPLDEDQLIESLEYLPQELVPEIPLLKHSIVDVRCKDNKGRQFIVEMQMFWTENFKSRVVFNASKAYIKQLEKGKEYNSLQPVYALSLVNDIFEHDTNQYYHHYKIVNIENTEKQLHGLEFVFIELPKFPLQSIAEKKLKILWLRFLTEITHGTNKVDEALLQSPEIKEALECLQESAFSLSEMESYDRYWDSISSEKTLFHDAETRGKLEGKLEGKIEIVKRMLEAGISIEDISTFTDLPKALIENLK
jgi:predicted transposase/invertase (TIGR01784 family)